MSGDRDDLRELLIELEYGELDAAARDAAQARIDEHPDLLRMQQAFRAVRDDLTAWDEVEGQPARIAFVTMPDSGQARSASAFGWMKGVAMAASFVLGILLAAAFANTTLTQTENGWMFNTGLSRAAAPSPTAPSSTAPSSTGPATTRPSPSQSSSAALSSTSTATPIGSPGVGRAAVRQPPVGQVQPFRMSTSGLGIDPMRFEMPGDREQQLRTLVREMVAAAEQRQQQQMDSLLSDLYQTFDTQRTSDLSVVFDELGLLRSSTGLELQRTNEVIDFLVTRMGGGIEAQVPEQRDE